MDDFEKRISDCVNEKLSDGTVERLIEEKLEKGISDAVGELFSYGGKAKKIIARKLEETMVPVIEKHDFNQYLVKLDSILTEIINNTTVSDNATILENFKQLMNPPVKDFSVVPVSMIYEEYKCHISENIDTSKLEINCDDGEPSYCNATTNMEVIKCKRYWFSSEKDEYVVKFTCDEDEDMNCEFKLSSRYSDSSLKIDATTIPMNVDSLRYLTKFEVIIQQLIRIYAKIDLDIMESFGDEVEISAEPEAEFR